MSVAPDRVTTSHHMRNELGPQRNNSFNKSFLYGGKNVFLPKRSLSLTFSCTVAKEHWEKSYDNTHSPPPQFLPKEFFMMCLFCYFSMVWTPYVHTYLYQVFLEQVRGMCFFIKIANMHPLRFQNPKHWLILNNRI